MTKSTTAAPSSKLACVAQAMLNGSLNYLQGSEELIELRDEMGIYANDPDFVVFVAVLSEVDYLRNSYGEIDWEEQLKEPLPNDIVESIAWAKEVSMSHCESIFNRYRAPHTGAL